MTFPIAAAPIEPIRIPNFAAYHDQTMSQTQIHDALLTGAKAGTIAGANRAPKPDSGMTTLSTGFDESKHERGQPANAGQFAKSAQAFEATKRAGAEPKYHQMAEEAASATDHAAAAKMHKTVALHHGVSEKANAGTAGKLHGKAKEAHLSAAVAREARVKLSEVLDKPGVAKGLFNSLKHAVQSGVKGANELHEAIAATFDDILKTMGA